jgi:hypothetical protein
MMLAITSDAISFPVVGATDVQLKVLLILYETLLTVTLYLEI